MTPIERCRVVLSLKNNEDESWGLNRQDIETIVADYDRMRKLLKLASDAFNNGSEDECCVACMEIARSLA